MSSITLEHIASETDAILFTLLAAVNWDNFRKVIDIGVVYQSV